MRVLIVAYACSPYRGSEFAVSWGLVKELSQQHELWVVVEEEKCRRDIEKYLMENPGELERVKFHYIKKIRNRPLRKLWPPSYYWYYRRWHKDVLALVEQLHRTSCFDVVHQLNMVGFREPGYLWKLGIPFVWGPIGGMGRLPWRFLPQLGFYGAMYYTGYNLLNALHERFLPRPKRAAQTAGNGLLAATEVDARGALARWGCECRVLAEVGLPPTVALEATDRLPKDPLRIVWSGQHVPGKALNLGLRALAKVSNDVSWELHVLGSGRMTQKWMQMASCLGISSRCVFHGWLPREEALRVVSRAHVSLVTSLRDLTSTVLIEALANGLPVICLDHCGFSAAVDDSCGIRVPVNSPREVIQGIASAVERLNDEGTRKVLSIGALHRAQDYSWAAKAEIVTRVYVSKGAE